MKTSKMSNIRSTKIQLSSVCILSFLLEIPRYFDYKIEEFNCSGETVYVRWPLGLVEDDLYQQIFRSGLYPLIKRYIPLFITSILTYHLVKFLIKSNRLRRTVLSSCVHNGNERNITDIDYLTKVLATIALVYIICLTPGAIYPILRLFIDTGACDSAYNYFVIVADTLGLVNSSVNFFIYYLNIPAFRICLVDSIGRSCTKRKNRHEMYTVQSFQW